MLRRGLSTPGFPPPDSVCSVHAFSPLCTSPAAGPRLTVSAPSQSKKKKLLAIGEVKGFQHDSVSHALATIERLGRESGIYDTYIRTDTQLVTKQKLDAGNAKNLDYFDAVIFYTTGELDMDDQQKKDLLSFVHDDGKGFIGIHSAIDTFYKWPEYGEMIGGYFNQHPWGVFDAPMVVEDPKFPGMTFPKTFTFTDEIYQVQGFQARPDPRDHPHGCEQARFDQPARLRRAPRR